MQAIFFLLILDFRISDLNKIKFETIVWYVQAHFRYFLGCLEKIIHFNSGQKRHLAMINDGQSKSITHTVTIGIKGLFSILSHSSQTIWDDLNLQLFI